MQNVSDAEPEANVQHWFSVASWQSAATWHSCTFVVSLQLCAMCVVHDAIAVHDVPSDAMLQLGKVPLPATSTPQHTGVLPLH